MGEIKKRTTAEIQREIELARQDLAITVQEMQLSVRDKLDWRRPIRKRPFVATGAALAVGFLIGLY